LVPASLRRRKYGARSIAPLPSLALPPETASILVLRCSFIIRLRHWALNFECFPSLPFAFFAPFARHSPSFLVIGHWRFVVTTQSATRRLVIARSPARRFTVSAAMRLHAHVLHFTHHPSPVHPPVPLVPLVQENLLKSGFGHRKSPSNIPQTSELHLCTWALF